MKPRKNRNTAITAFAALASTPLIIAFIVIAVGVLPWIAIFLMTMLMPATHTPVVRQASFPISIEYVLDEETFVYTDTLNINFEGISRMIGESEREVDAELFIQ